MTKATLLTITLLGFMVLCAQDTLNPGLLICRYDKVKKGICSERAWFSEPVVSRKAYSARWEQLRQEYKDKNVDMDLVSDKECVIVYQFKQDVAGWHCAPVVYGLRKGPTIEDCERQLEEFLATFKSEYKDMVRIVFRWKGKNSSIQRDVLTEDFGGLTGKFTLIDKPDGTDCVIAQLKNTTKDKLAIALVAATDGKIVVEYIYPGITLTKKYNSKAIDIQVMYQQSSEPKPKFSVIDWVKDLVRKQVTKEKGHLKIGKSAAIGVRG